MKSSAFFHTPGPRAAMWSARRRKLLSLTAVFLLSTSLPHVTDGQIRLAGSTQCSGRVEISHGNAWGTVCDDGWDLDDATVVCRELGCGPAGEAKADAYFGEGTGNIWLDEVTCSGAENSLAQCSHRGFGVENCGHGEDAGVVCSDQLPPPRLSPASSALRPGEDLFLTCWVSPHVSIPLRISFYKDGVLRDDGTISARQTFEVMKLSKVDSTDQGTYSCRYATPRATSSTSLTVTVTVVRLQQPRASLTSPDPEMLRAPDGTEVTEGQSFAITCSLSSSYTGGVFALALRGSRSRDTKPEVDRSASFSFPAAQYKHQGNYSCTYEVHISQRKFTSAKSEPVGVIIRLRLQRPNISLTSPETGLIWAPAGAQVTVGHSFVITCWLSSAYPGGLFILTFSGSSSTDTKPEVDRSASFNISVAEYKHQGNYSCMYEIQLSLRKFTTSKSKAISVIIEPTLVLLVSLAGAGALLLLLLVPIVVCVVRGRRAKESGAHEHSQMTVGVTNQYEDSDKEEEVEEEEEDYVNIEPGDLKKMQRQFGVAGEEESDEGHDYEEAQSDAHRDYVDGDETYVTVEGSRDDVWRVHAFVKDEEEEEDEEEEGSDADDYVNVSQAFVEDVVDIYGGEEDIYEIVQ